ncbi:MAG: DUF1572 domain-containing protein [Bacteroidetes bacterium]|nr:DUF1572 domain-containing protein [Bacteroidota bacterium]
MEKTAHLIARQLCQETHRRICEEGIVRIKKCLDQLSLTEIWYRPNENSNSVGNLVLHLCGNVRQWAISTLGKQADVRNRKAEFEERGPLAKQQLIMKLDKLEADLLPVLDALQPSDLAAEYRVQGFRESGTAILLHVSEHFSYHLGQITYFVKMKKDIDVNYYGDQDLDATGK